MNIATEGLEKMKGALVFLAVFAIVVIVTLGNTAIPPGQAIYNAVLPNTEAASGYLVGGQVDAVTAIIAVFNGVIYGFIAWLIFTVLMMLGGKRKERPQNISQVVNVNVPQKNDSPPPPP